MQIRDREQLTEKEREVLRLVAAGYRYRDVGELLTPRIKVATVKYHMRNIMYKYGAYSSHEAFIEALHCKAITLADVPRIKTTIPK